MEVIYIRPLARLDLSLTMVVKAHYSGKLARGKIFLDLPLPIIVGLMYNRSILFEPW